MLRSHCQFYAQVAASDQPGEVVVLPANCGTAPAVHGPVRLAHQVHLDVVAIFPSDHSVDNDRCSKSFSEAILGNCGELAFLRVSECGWTDLGTPERLPHILKISGNSRPRAVLPGALLIAPEITPSRSSELGRGAMLRRNKRRTPTNRQSALIAERENAGGSTAAAFYYADIVYRTAVNGTALVGLLIEASEEQTAWSAAVAICTEPRNRSIDTTILNVVKVILQ